MALRALALVLALALLLPGAAAAQETYTNGVVTGGRASASSTRTAAQVRFSRAWRVDEIVPCTAAAHIGGGCTLGAPPRP